MLWGPLFHFICKNFMPPLQIYSKQLIIKTQNQDNKNEHPGYTDSIVQMIFKGSPTQTSLKQSGFVSKWPIFSPNKIMVY